MLTDLADPENLNRWRLSDNDRPLNLRWLRLQHCRLLGAPLPPDRDVIVPLGLALGDTPDHPPQPPESSVRRRLDVQFAEARKLASNADLRFSAELFALAGYSGAAAAGRLGFSPTALALFYLLHFDLSGRHGAVDFLVREAALPEMGLLADRQAERRFAIKVSAILGGQRGVAAMLGRDALSPRRGIEGADASAYLDSLGGHGLADDITVYLVDLFSLRPRLAPNERAASYARIVSALPELPRWVEQLSPSGAERSRMDEYLVSGGKKWPKPFGVDRPASVIHPL